MRLILNNKSLSFLLLVCLLPTQLAAQDAGLPVIVSSVEERTLNSDIQALGTLQANETAHLASP